MAGHQNRKQKLAYLEKIREENTQLANERNKFQAGVRQNETFQKNQIGAIKSGSKYDFF